MGKPKPPLKYLDDQQKILCLQRLLFSSRCPNLRNLLTPPKTPRNAQDDSGKARRHAKTQTIEAEIRMAVDAEVQCKVEADAKASADDNKVLLIRTDIEEKSSSSSINSDMDYQRQRSHAEPRATGTCIFTNALIESIKAHSSHDPTDSPLPSQPCLFFEFLLSKLF